MATGPPTRNLASGREWPSLRRRSIRNSIGNSPLLPGGISFRRKGSNALMAGTKASLDQRKYSTTSLSQFVLPEKFTKARRESMYARSASRAPKKPITCIPFIIRFRRAAKLVRTLCKIFAVCKSNFNFSDSNNWLAMTKHLLCESNLQKSDENQQNDATNETGLSKQMFDISQFRRMTTKRDVIPSKMKDLLRKSPYVRSAAENANVRRFLQKFEVFSRYPIDVQNGFSSSGWLEEFAANRVILLKGHHASCLYFILSGRLVSNERDGDKDVTNLLKSGDKFGEDDIVAEENRQMMVVTQDISELFAIHKKDYMRIMNKIGVKDAESLNICRSNPVFNHWPLETLKQNTFAWNIQNYKPGTLIVHDSSQCEWVYVVKSGMCKVIRCIRPDQRDPDPEIIRKRLAREAREKLIAKIKETSQTAFPPLTSPERKVFFTLGSRPQTTSTTVCWNLLIW